MANFLRAVGCLLLACLGGLILLGWGIDERGGWPVSPVWIYCCIVIVASPFWLLIFLPLYLALSAKSVFWRWYVAPLVGVLVGFLGIFILDKGKLDLSDVATRTYLGPVFISFCTFLLGTMFKKLPARFSS